MNNTVLHDGQFSITKEQLRQLTDPKVKEWFPEVFKVKLEVGKWYKSKIGLFCITKIENNTANAYGFHNGIWKDKGRFTLNVAENDVEATKKEVFEALKNEAVKRGLVEGTYFKSSISGYDYEFTNIRFTESFDMVWSENGGVIFDNGVWTTILQTITKSEAEKMLNRKIID